jgi:hypothetical protein
MTKKESTAAHQMSILKIQKTLKILKQNTPLLQAKLDFLAPPCTVDFLTNLRNNFDKLIVPRLDQTAKEAYLSDKCPSLMNDFERRKIRSSMLNAVYGEYVIFLHRASLLDRVINKETHSMHADKLQLRNIFCNFR